MQTTQNQNATPSLPGMIYGEPSQTRFLSDRLAEAGPILMGLFVCTGTDAAQQAKVPAASADVTAGLLGVAMYNAAKPTANGVSAAEYETDEPIDIVHTGYVWAYAEKAMAMRAGVFIRITANGGNTVLGKVTDGADSGNCIQATGVRVAQACTAAGPVLLEIYLPQSS